MDKTIFTFGEDKKRLVVERTFEVPVAKVWGAWTNSELLDQWWAPEPYKAVTQSFDFREGGQWRYYMQGPEGDRHYCILNYRTISLLRSFSAIDSFCDRAGNINTQMPSNRWHNEFVAEDNKTLVKVSISFNSSEDMQKILEMGFKEGFSIGLNQLDTLLRA